MSIYIYIIRELPLLTSVYFKHVSIVIMLMESSVNTLGVLFVFIDI